MAALGLGLSLAGLSRGGAGGSQPWTPANLANPPSLSIDADRLDLLTKDGSNVLLSVNTVHTGLASNTPSVITHQTAHASFNNHGAFVSPGTPSTLSLNFSTNFGGLLNAKAGCTMVFFGRFGNANPGAFNSAIVNATATSASTTRCSIAASPSTSNCPRYTVRRLDGDTANGDDVTPGVNVGQALWIAILRLDNNGAVVGAGTPTKHIRFTQSGVRTTLSEATGLGSGNFSTTNSAYIGFFNSGTTAQAWVDMHYGAIEDSVYSDADVERLEGYLAHKVGMPEILPSDHPYRNDPPTA